MPTTAFYSSVSTEMDWQCSSEPMTIIDVHESDCWPVDDNSESGAKDQLAAGLHPVVALGGRAVADGRPFNLTGVVVDYTAGLTTASGIARVNIADGVCVRNWVANVLTYSGTVPDTFETAPVPFQPVYVDDSQALAAGVTLSMSELNEDGLENPLAGHLIYCQDEMRNDMVGGVRTAATFDVALSNSLVQQVYCIVLSNGWRELAP